MQIFLKLEAFAFKYVNITVAPIEMRAKVTVKGYPKILVTRSYGYHNYASPAAESSVVKVTLMRVKKLK